MKTISKLFATFILCFSTQVFAQSADSREVIWLTDTQRTAVLAEMRQFLTASQQILAASLDENPDAIEAAARPMGIKSMKGTPQSLREKLPSGFGQLGSKTHQGFEEIANEAVGMGDTSIILRQLSELQKNCIACHARYQLKATP